MLADLLDELLPVGGCHIGFKRSCPLPQERDENIDPSGN